MNKVTSGREMLIALEKLKKETERLITEANKKLAFDAFRDLANLTPWLTGRARSNWQVEVNKSNETSYSTGYNGAVWPDPLIQFGDSIHLFNNVSYMEYLEDGHSKKAPMGIVEPVANKYRIVARMVYSKFNGKKL